MPIGNDEFREIREMDYYYVDKSLMIKDFIEMGDKVALIARPRRFGKPLGMTTIREFFDITKDSKKLFEGLNIMKTPYAEQINSRPVIYLTLKDCKGLTSAEMFALLKNGLYNEYLRYEKLFCSKWETESYEKKDFYDMIDVLRNSNSNYIQFVSALRDLTRIVHSQMEWP